MKRIVFHTPLDKPINLPYIRQVTTKGYVMIVSLSAADLLPVKPEFVPLSLQATIEGLQSLLKAEKALMIRMASQPGMGKKARQEAAVAHALRIKALQSAIFKLLECP